MADIIDIVAGESGASARSKINDSFGRVNDMSGGNVYTGHKHEASDVTVTPPASYTATNQAALNTEFSSGVKNPTDIVATISSAGISAGETVSQYSDPWDFVRQLIAPYVPPSFASFSMNFDVAGTVEIGRTVTITNATFSFNNDSAGNPPTDLYITGTGWDAGTAVTSSPASPNSTPTSFTLTAYGSSPFSIYGSDALSNSLSRSTSKSFWYMHRFGASATEIVDAGTAQTVIDSLANNALTSNKSRVVTCDATNNDVTKYTYIAYDSSYGDISAIIQNGALPVLGAFTKLSDYPYTNAYGVTRTMRVYKSNSTGAFADGASLSIS